MKRIEQVKKHYFCRKILQERHSYMTKKNENLKTPKQALNHAFLKQNLKQEEIDLFKKELVHFIDKINETETEEHNKRFLIDFLNEVYYKKDYEINTYNPKNKIKADLAVKQKESSFVEMLIEVKRPTSNSSAEMLSREKLNKKALQELLLYYMSERLNNQNKKLRHLIVTNMYEWFVFDAANFYELFIEKNKSFENECIEYFKKMSESDTTKYFYKQIASPEIEKQKDKIAYVYFDIRKYKDKSVNDEDFTDLYKFLSPIHLLKRDVLPDSNKLNKEFYNELLHILGLIEKETEGKIKIERKSEKDRNEGSLLELTITELQTQDISQINDLNTYGENIDEQMFGIAFSLVITWINRILFMKLLEAQLLRYHNHHPDYAFLMPEKVNGYRKLYELFFQILAQPIASRSKTLKEFEKIPYLNSSLFEETELEKVLNISLLSTDIFLPLYGKSVLTHKNITALEYLLQFLNVYDFSGKGDDPNKLISAAVLGLIFEKINGYKDGSFFTPSFITMYMCRETIGRAVIQKFNDVNGWKCENIDDLYNHFGKNTDDIKKANEIFNTIRICDPAVGSGHFLVSALNEMIYLKSKLGILADDKHRILNAYQINIENDELTVKHNGEFVKYEPFNEESQRLQKTLFHEKQTLIENCLFGVDINPNSVKICQLRLWIELLKNAYYHSETNELQTLPNIDINIKCGNSLMSRFDINEGFSSLPTELQKKLETISKIDPNKKYSTLPTDLQRELSFATKEYKEQVKKYRCLNDKFTKKTIREKIAQVKKTFGKILSSTDIDYRNWKDAEDELLRLRFSDLDFQNEKESWKVKDKQLQDDVTAKKEKFEQKIKPYANALEWRFEFPEVLDDDGNFVGFDVVIGNPPWGVRLDDMQKKCLSAKFTDIPTKTKDTYLYFIKQSFLLLQENAFCSLITPNTWLLINNTENFRKQMLEKKILQIVDYGDGIFQEATVESSSFLAQNNNQTEKVNAIKYAKGHIETNLLIDKHDWIENDGCRILIEVNDTILMLIKKIKANNKTFDDYCSITWGIKPYQVGFGIPAQTREMMDNRIYHSDECLNDEWKPLLVGKNINKYYLTKNEQFIKYGKNLMYPSNEEIMLQDKIFLRQTSSDIKATLDTEKYYCQNSVFLIFSKIINLKFLLGLLNSKLIGFYYKTNNPQTGKIFAEIKPVVIKSIPIPDISAELQQPIITLVDQILSAKKENPAADTSELEREIDLLVYGLYGLTEEEVNIIDGGR